MASPNLKYNIQPLQGCPTGECQPWVAPTATNIEAFQASVFGYCISDCVTVTQPHWAWKWVTIGCKDIYEWQWPQLQFLGAATAYASSEGVVLVAANPGDGMSFEMEVTPNVESQVHLEINSLELAKNASIQVLGEKDGNWEVLGEAPIKDAEGVVLNITPKTNKIKVVLWGPIKVWIGRICVMGLQWVEEDQLVTICDGDGDKYRFGYNGIEKDNAVSGVGNHYSAQFGHMDARLGRRWNLDPKPDPSSSAYSLFANSPIWMSDVKLDTPTVKEAALMSKLAYGDKLSDAHQKEFNKSGWKISNAAQGIKLSDPESGLKSILFERTIDGKTEFALAYAGTEVKDIIKDGSADLKQIFGMSKQYDQALHNAKRLSNLLGGKELTFTGHSLGGGLANASALYTGKVSLTFNPAWVSKATMLRYDLNNKSQKVVNNYVIFGEVLDVVQTITNANLNPQVNLLKNVGNRHYLRSIKSYISLLGSASNHMIDNVIEEIEDVKKYNTIKDGQ